MICDNNILSYSLYGDNRRYFNALCKNIEFIDLNYRNFFTISIVIGLDVPSKWVDMLSKSSAVLVMSNDKSLENIPKLLYRLYPILSEQGDTCFFRDADSYLTKNEMDSMLRFVGSNYMYHIVRDHPNHLAPIMGGLFGIKSARYKVFKETFFEHIGKYKSWHNKKSGARGEQLILADHIYPIAYKEAFIESNFVIFWNERLLTSKCQIPKLQDLFMGQIDPEFNPDAERDMRDYKNGSKKIYPPYWMFKLSRYRYLYRLYLGIKN
jgi:hypothetical protein